MSDPVTRSPGQDPYAPKPVSPQSHTPQSNAPHGGMSQGAMPGTTSAAAAAGATAQGAADAAKKAASEARPAADALKDQAGQAAQDAKSTVSALAEEARTRLSEIVDQQKTAGADQVAGVARAAKSAAGDLRRTSPQLARLVESAAASVDHVAEDIRSHDISDVISTVSDFGRRQPVALFGGAVLAGFLLARFLKSDAPATGSPSRSPNYRSV